VVELGPSVIRHLTYHLAPLASARGNWRWNVDQLVRRWPIFTGRKLIAVATGENCDPLDVVQAAFPPDAEFIAAPNDRELREAVTFPKLCAAVIDEPGITFFAHAKGASYYEPRTNAPHLAAATNAWSTCMYRGLLDAPAKIDAAMADRWFFSLLMRNGRFDCFDYGAALDWHLCGTFFWFSNERVRRANWREHLPPHRYAVEQWPTWICQSDKSKAGTVLGEFLHEEPYEARQWRKVWGPATEAWLQAVP